MYYNDKKIENLRYHLKLKFGLPQDRPTNKELGYILNDIKSIPKNKLDEKKWEEIVLKHVKFDGKYIYEGLDFSDLNVLYAQIINE